MYQTFIAIALSLVCLIHAAVFTESGDHPEIERERGSLAERIKEIAMNRFQEGSNSFKVPTGDQQKAWKEIVKKILKNKIRKAQKIIERRSFPYRIVRFTDETMDREYILLEEQPVRHGWGFYAFNLKSKKHLVIEVPHPINDANTDHEGIAAFLETRAKALLIAGAHRRTNSRLSPCTQASPRSRYMESDVAHATQTMFHQTHEVLLDKYSDAVAVQLHGMRTRETCPNVFLSSGTKDVTTNSKKLLNCLERNKVESGLFDGKTHTCILVARTNVQGRHANGKADKSCTEYAESSPEPGRFIHVEQEPEIRESPKSWRPVIEALKCAFPAE